MDPKDWPKTLDDAVTAIISKMTAENQEKIRNFTLNEVHMCHFGWGLSIRNRFGLWAGNEELLRSCDPEYMHPDKASGIIMEAVWKKLQDK